MVKTFGEYNDRGEYHKHLDPNWNYYPIYIRKTAFIDNYLHMLNDKSIRILDAGCGEGVLVDKYKQEKYNITGLDINYESNDVARGDILNMPFNNGAMDMVLFLDVIEHLDISKQETALLEINRVLKKNGTLIISIPNLANKDSRWEFFFTGKFKRTAGITKHPGDRPIKEYLDIFDKLKFKIIERLPIELRLPKFQDKILRFILGQKKYEDFIYSPKRNPDDCFLNIFVLNKL